MQALKPHIRLHNRKPPAARAPHVVPVVATTSAKQIMDPRLIPNGKCKSEIRSRLAAVRTSVTWRTADSRSSEGVATYGRSGPLFDDGIRRGWRRTDARPPGPPGRRAHRAREGDRLPVCAPKKMLPPAMCGFLCAPSSPCARATKAERTMSGAAWLASAWRSPAEPARDPEAPEATTVGFGTGPQRTMHRSPQHRRGRRAKCTGPKHAPGCHWQYPVAER